MGNGRLTRSWRLPDGDLLAEVEGRWAADYYRLKDSRLVGSYLHRLADDCELMYIYGYRVVEGCFEHVTHVEVGYPHRRDVVDVGDRIFEGLVELPDGSVTPERLIEAGVTDLDGGAAGAAAPTDAAAHGRLDATGRLRAAFAGYPMRPVLEGCPHCRGTVVVGDEDLYTLSIRLGGTVGTRDDLKSYLPMLLEQLVTTDELDESVVLGHLTTAPGWRTWPRVERAAIDGFLHAVWRELLSAYPAQTGAFRDAETFLRAMDELYGDIGPFVRAWDDVRTPEADRHLADLVDCWTYRERFPAAVVAWMHRPAIRNRLYDSFAADPDGPAADDFARAHDLLGTA